MLRSSLKAANSLTSLTRRRITSHVLSKNLTTSSLPRTCQRPIAVFLTLPKRTYTTRSVPPEVQPESSSEPSAEQEKWISVLENTASAPWLYTLPPDLSNRLRLAYTLLFQIVIYLGRPVDPSQAEQFLIAFSTLPAPPHSEIGRARKAIQEITRAICFHLGSIPEGHGLRREQREVFDVFGALQVTCDALLVTQEAPGKGEDSAVLDLENWRMFWERAQPVLLELGMKLDEKGFGLDFDELKREEDEARAKAAAKADAEAGGN